MRARIDPHARFRELIAARLDRPLTRVELRTLNGHMKKCAACQNVDAVYRSERNLLRALPPSIPPRDLWARTSASLDREVARAYRARKWGRRITRGRRSAQPSSALMTAVAAIGVTAAIAVLQLAPTFSPAASVPGKPTPRAVVPQQFSYLGLGLSDIAVYRTEVSQVCPASAPLDCVESEKIVRTPVGLPPSMRSGNVSLSPSGRQMAVVGHYTGQDLIAVVTMPESSGDGGQIAAATVDPGGPVHTDGGSKTGASAAPDQSASPAKSRNPEPPGQTADPAASGAPGDNGPGGDTSLPTDMPSAPPASVVPGLAVLAILEDVQSAGSPPEWSPNGETLAFSAMPVDASRGPDVYIWSPGDDKARAITTDHGSYFASWSGNRIVLSRLDGYPQRPSNFVIDPRTLEEREVGGSPVWLPTVNASRTEAIAWYGQLDTSGRLPSARSGALYLMDWASVDPFGTSAADTGNPPPTDNAQTDDSPPDSNPLSSTPAPDDNTTLAPDASAEPTATLAPDAPTPTLVAPAPPRPANTPDAAPDGSVPGSLVPLEPDRDPRSAPVVDWQVRWSTDGQVLGVWIADSAGSTWGRLAVFAVDPSTARVSRDNPLLSMTMARRGFSLGMDRVAWVGPSDENVDGELRIRTWGTDGVGGLRLRAPDQEEVMPAF
jgi:hypothetical protein